MEGERTSQNLPDRYGLIAFLFYLILSVLFFGLNLAGHLSDRYVGQGTDPGHLIFFLAWWAHALTHHLNPFLITTAWAPSGYNLAHATSVPLVSILAAPFTLHFGPVPTYNVVELISPALAAWSAFLLCRYVSSAQWPSLVGGYVFGFSPYMLCHLLAHLHLTLVFPIPLIVLATLARLDERISSRSFAVLFSLLTMVESLCSLELVATSAFFGAVAMLVGWWCSPVQTRQKLRALLLPILCGYAVSAIVLSPYFYYFFAFVRPNYPAGFESMSVDLSSVLIPSSSNIFGTLTYAKRWCTGVGIYEVGAYLGAPALVVLLGFARSQANPRRKELLTILLAVILIASFGRTLMVFGRETVPLPWRIFSHLPILNKAVPIRFSVFTFLVLALIVALWLSQRSVSIAARAIAGTATVLLLLPNVDPSYWVTPLDAPAFFSAGLYKQYLSAGDNVLIIPYGVEGNSDIWLSNSRMYFSIAGGWLGPLPMIPSEFQHSPLVYALYDLAAFPDSGEELKAFLAQKQIHAVIIADEGAHFWVWRFGQGLPWPERISLDPRERDVLRSLFSTLDVMPLRVGGVSLYKIPLEKLDAYKKLDLRDLELHILTDELDTLIVAAQDLLTSGVRLADVSPLEAARQGLIPRLWLAGISGSPTIIKNGLLLAALERHAWPSVVQDGPFPAPLKGQIAVGVLGSPDVLEQVATKYRADAADLAVAPPLVVSTNMGRSSQRLLVVTYDRKGLFRGAEAARVELAGSALGNASK